MDSSLAATAASPPLDIAASGIESSGFEFLLLVALIDSGEDFGLAPVSPGTVGWDVSVLRDGSRECGEGYADAPGGGG